MEQSESLTSTGIDEATYEEFVDCIVPKISDTVSEDGLSTIVDSGSLDDGDNLSQQDQDALTDASTDCASVMAPDDAK